MAELDRVSPAQCSQAACRWTLSDFSRRQGRRRRLPGPVTGAARLVSARAVLPTDSDRPPGVQWSPRCVRDPAKTKIVEAVRQDTLLGSTECKRWSGATGYELWMDSRLLCAVSDLRSEVSHVGEVAAATVRRITVWPLPFGPS